MTKDTTPNTTPYVAMKPIRVGNFDLKPGDPVPVIEGRNYDALKRKNMIRDVREAGLPLVKLPAHMREDMALAGEKAAAALVQPLDPNSTAPVMGKDSLLFDGLDLSGGITFIVRTNDPAYLVSETGAALPCIFLGLVEVDAQNAERLGVTPHSLVARIQTGQGEDATTELVKASRLLPMTPTDDLLADIAAGLELGEAEGVGAIRVSDEAHLFVPGLPPEVVEVLALNLVRDQVVVPAGVNFVPSPEGDLFAEVKAEDKPAFIVPQRWLVSLGAGRELADRLAALSAEPPAAPEGQAAPTPEAVGAVSATYIHTGQSAFYIASDGMPYRVKVIGEHPIPLSAEDAAEMEGVPEGTLLIKVQDETEEGTGETYSVNVDDLLPVAPVSRLVAEFEGLLEGEGDSGEDEPEESEGHSRAELEAENAYLALVLDAVRAQGEELPEKFPSRATLILNGIRTIPGVVMLAEGEGGTERLSALYKISDAQAANIVSALVASGHITEVIPEGEDAPAQSDGKAEQ